jgi:hypothetical protein
VSVRAFLRPTWVTWTVALLPAALVPLFSLFRLRGPLFLFHLALVQVPFAVFRRLGLPVGRRGDWFGHAFPNAFGWALIAAADLAVLYLLGCVVSAAWFKARAARERRAE